MKKVVFAMGLLPVWQQLLAQQPTDSAHTQLKQIVVSAPRIEIAMMHVDLKKIPVNTAQDLLRKVPGLFISQHAGGGKAEQIFLRGFDCDHGTDVNISADGIPVNIVSHAHGQGYSDLHFLIPETVESIDFGKGAYYPEKGDFNTAGYVNFATYDHLDNSMIKVEGGSFNTMRLAGVFNLLADKSAAKRNAYVATEYNYTNGPFDVQQQFSRFNLFGKYNQWLNDKDYISFQASTFTSGWNASGQIPERAVAEGLISRWGSIDPTEGGNTSRTNAALTYRHQASADESWQSFFFYSRYQFNLYSNFTFFLKDPVHGDEIQQKDDRSIYGFEQQYTHDYTIGNSRLTWQSGAGLRLDDIQDLELNHVYRRDTLLNRLAWGSGRETNLDAYTGLTWHTGHWRINPAVRVDHFIFNYQDKLKPANGDPGVTATRVSPKLNFSYSTGSIAQWYLKTGMGFHSNDMRVVMQQHGKDILPFSAGADLGVVLKPVPNLLIQPALWYLYLQQEFVYVGDEAVVEPSGKTRRLGVDVSVRYQPVKWLYLDADVNYAHAREIGQPKGANYIPLAPVLTSTGGIGVNLPIGFSANLRYRYMKDRPANEANSLVAQGYFVNDLMLAYTHRQFQFTVQAQNLFNVNWNEAQFETETRLQHETESVTDMCFTPGTPFYLKAGVAIRF
ncbi:TonB-dependent receptor [Chitinophaga varians]|uniref:TonB-dependent receptor n=1 Tax=Chitinophaga varians TaxID=2202339 RepID=UPI00165F96A1|nr:TonB-dependent receptor plug domain-containing protein [Chitinophaga varians]MBC9912033.1 TonB-dependent receptor plug domain-containing protein [Chitinophaga varians]